MGGTLDQAGGTGTLTAEQGGRHRYGLREGFELPNDDLPDRRSNAGERIHNVTHLHANSADISVRWTKRHLEVRILLYRGGLVSSTFRLLRRLLGSMSLAGSLASLRDRHCGPPMMGSGGCGGPISRGVLAARRAAGAGFETDSPHPSSLRGHRFHRSAELRFSPIVFYCA